MFLLAGQTVSASAKNYAYYGSKLTGTDRTTYDKLLANARNGLHMTTLALPSYAFPDPDIGDMIENDYPRIYWILSYMVKSRFTWTRLYMWYRPVEKWQGAYAQRGVFNQKVNAVVKKLKKKCKGRSKVYKARIALDYLAKHCTYRSSIYDQTAYGVFVNKSAVCAGYARAYKLLMDELGIPCICVSGFVGGESHMINLVKISKKWYYVDPTWCDVGKKASYKYFLLGKNNRVFRYNFIVSYGTRLPSLAKKSIKNVKKYK